MARVSKAPIRDHLANFRQRQLPIKIYATIE